MPPQRAESKPRAGDQHTPQPPDKGQREAGGGAQTHLSKSHCVDAFRCADLGGDEEEQNADKLGAQLLLVAELFVLLRAVGEPFLAIHPFLIEAVTKFIGIAFFFIPAQIGASEGVYAVAFGQVGLSAAAGFTLAFVRRLRSLLVAAAGLGFSPLWVGPAADRGSP